MSRAVLVHYSALPSTPHDIIANHHLGSLAGVLIDAGHDVLVIDLATVSVMERLYPPHLAQQVLPLAQQLFAGVGDPRKESELLAAYRKPIDEHEEATVAELAGEIIQQARDFSADFVAFQLSEGDGFEGSVKMAEALRAAMPDVHIYTAGGRRSAAFREHIHRYTDVFEAVIHGDAEEAILPLAEHAAGARELSSIPGIAWVEDGQFRMTERSYQLDLNTLPMPVYDPAIYPAMAGDDKIKIISIDDTRGCPNRCAFCSHPEEDGLKQRMASPVKIVDTMAALQRKFGISVYRLCGSSTPGKLMYGLAQEIIVRDLKLEWISFGHFRTQNPDHFGALVQSGLYSLFFGIESGCQGILDRAIHKGTDLKKVKQAARAAQEAGVFVVGSMIAPLPFDTPETIQESLQYVMDLRPDAAPVQFPGLMPLSLWTLDPGKYNMEVGDVDELMLDLLTYRMRLLFPPRFWQPLPYKMNGMAFHEFAPITMQFSAKLEESGILTNFSHTLAMIAKCAGMAPREFRDAVRMWLVTGNVPAVQEMVTAANRTITRSETRRCL